MNIVPRPEVLEQLYFFVSELTAFVQNRCPQLVGRIQVGRNHKLTPAELLTISLYRFVTKQQDFKTYYGFLKGYHAREFPQLPHYSQVLRYQKQLLPFESLLLSLLMAMNRSNFKNAKEYLMFVDGSEIPVCTNKRIFTHKVSRIIAQRSKSSKGWFYGFRLHILCDRKGNLLGIKITPGNIDERKMVLKLIKDLQGILVADAGYISSELQKKLSGLNVWFLTGVKKNQKKLMTKANHLLLKARQRVETTIGVLKQRLGLVTSLPRSVPGYQVHYVLVCLAYCIFGMMKKKQLGT